MRKENKLVEESLAFVKVYMADKSNDNYGSHYQLELDYAYEDGSKDNQIATAKRMIENDYSNEEITKISGLSISKIKVLRKEM